MNKRNIRDSYTLRFLLEKGFYDLYLFINKISFLEKENASLIYYIQKLISLVVFVLLFILIIHLIPIHINYALYIDRIIAIGFNFKLIKLTTNLTIGCTNFSLICGFSSNLLILFVGLITSIVSIIQDNWTIGVLNILSYIFVKALMKNFLSKHKIMLNKFNTVEYIQIILNNWLNIFIFFFKLFIVSLLLRLIIRGSIALLFNGYNNNVVASITVILLSITIYYYLYNFILKFIKKENITSNDLYLYNDFVIERVNLYNIICIILISTISRYYFELYLIVIGIIIISIFVYLICISKWYNCIPARDHIILQSGGEAATAASYLSSFIPLGVFLQQSCTEGFMETLVDNKKTPFQIHFSKESDSWIYQNIKGTSNLMDPSFGGYSYESQSPYEMSLHKKEIKDSPILNMAYRQTKNEGTSKSELGVRFKLRSVFYNRNFKGSILVSKERNYGVITVIEKDNESSIFLPTYYIIDESPLSMAKWVKTKNILIDNYGISFGSGEIKIESMIILTQGEVVGRYYPDAEDLYSGLFKRWIISPHYTEPSRLGKTIKDYYKLEESQEKQNEDAALNKINRIKDFDCYRQDINNIKKEVWRSTFVEAKLDREVVKESTGYNSEDDGDELNIEVKNIILDRTLRADHAYIDIIKKYISQGVSKFPANYFEFIEHNRNFNEDLSIDELIIKTWNEYSFGDPLWKFKARRDYSIDWELFNTRLGKSTVISVSKDGLLEGPEKHWVIGANSDADFIIETDESRNNLIDKILSGREHFTQERKVKEVYGISINRLTFEFLSVRFNSDMGESPGYKLYSITDSRYEGKDIIHSYKLKTAKVDLSVVKQDYNFFDDDGEHAIRKGLDFAYANDWGSFPYDSKTSNKK